MKFTASIGCSFVFVLSLLAAATGCSSAAADGCTKDTDCASGRICGGDGRCVDRGGEGSGAAASSTDTGADAADATTGGTLVDQCSADLKCNVENNILLSDKYEEDYGKLRRVGADCRFIVTDRDGHTSDHPLEADGEIFAGKWTSDSSHLVVNIGSGNIIYDCTPTD